MKATINGIEVEGTPDEFKEFLGKRNNINAVRSIKFPSKKRKKYEFNGWDKIKEYKDRTGCNLRVAFKYITGKNISDTDYIAFKRLFGRLNKKRRRSATTKKVNVNRAYTEKDKKLLKEMFDHGYTISQIANVLKRTRKAIKMQLFLMRNKQTAKIPVANKKEKWTTTEIETLIKEKKMGNSNKNIAKLLDRSLDAIKAKSYLLSKKKSKKK